MRDNIGTIIGLVFGSIFFVALANEFVIFYSEIKYEEVTFMEEALKIQRKVHTIDISENSINNFILPKLDKGLSYEQRTY